MMNAVDILENEILELSEEILEILLRDHTSKKNIFWGTDNYENLGNGYEFNSEIKPEQITGDNGNVIMPRVKKLEELGAYKGNPANELKAIENSVNVIIKKE